MIARRTTRRPAPWNTIKSDFKHSWLLPLRRVEWLLEWTAYALSRWSFLEVLEYLGSLSVLIGVIFYFSESGDRIMQRHYQAWQVINTAQGKGGSGGRIEALQELNADKVPLVGVDVSSAFLQGLTLRRASLLRANFEAADLRDCNFESADLQYASLHFANLRKGNLRNARLSNAVMEDSDLVGATLENVDLTGVNLKDADLRDTDLHNVRWQNIADISSANIYGVRNAPEGFTQWALGHGAVSKP